MRPSPADPSGIRGRLPTLITGLLNRVVKNTDGPTKEAFARFSFYATAPYVFSVLALSTAAGYGSSRSFVNTGVAWAF
jgi:hypothetical protein